MESDEIRITTSREIKVCEGAIKKLEKIIGALEKKHKIASVDFLRRFDPDTNTPNSELTRWYDSCYALEQWKERLSAHWQIMNM